MLEKKTRAMTPKWFLTLASKNGLKSAEAFISAHREWLESGDLASVMSPILSKIDTKEIFPTPGLETIKSIVLDHMIAADTAKAEAAMNRSSEPKVEKPYVSLIKFASGEPAFVLDEAKNEKHLRASFDHPQDAERWCQRRLNDGSPGWYGEVIWTKVTTKSGTPMVTKIDRNLSISALTPRNRSKTSRA